ncbi:chemotaxis protein CheX [Blastococcus sp. CT_GayMR16]|uniref:chemotaxis protein CheX n=1 Tax=Blastococcus sp. CT_GayMR16 TaxID=2559607 RepID=UPI001073A411|nr:chemotaxis protein CheX [Blastococcus sp. CT_GayMR16]TFV87960.1 chemotaxis protein CheX [Blastococcus sp. CT_GayMR16]
MTELQDTGLRRRADDAAPSITDLIDEETVQSIAQEAWSALVGEDEFLVPLPGDLPEDAVSSWVDVRGPWNGTVVITTGRSTAEQLSRELLKEHAPPVLDEEDIEDGLGELANVVGGNVKAVLPGPSALGLPVVGDAPVAGPDTCRVDLLWRGQSLTISVQGTAGALLDQ